MSLRIVSLIFALMLCTEKAHAYDFLPLGDDSFVYEQEAVTVGSCTFNANYFIDDSDELVYGELELQSYLPGLGFSYIGPKFTLRYDRSICEMFELLFGPDYPFFIEECSEGPKWETLSVSQLTEANIESSCGVSILDGTFQTSNSYAGSEQTYSSTTRQAISFATATKSYSLMIDSQVGILKSVVDIVPATAPTNLVATPGNGQVSVAFTAPSDNGSSAITDYKYQLDDGSWVSAATTSSPVVITGLTNGTSYAIKLRAVSIAGDGTESSEINFTPITTTSAPTNLVATPGNGQVSVAFTAPSDNGGSAITNYQYSVDGGGEWTAFSPAVTSSPVTIGDLVNEASYSISLRAINSGGVGEPSLVSSVTTDGISPTLAITGPTEAVTEDFTVMFTFSEDVTNFNAEDIRIINGSKGAFSGSGAVYSLVITPDVGTKVSVSVDAGKAQDAAGNGNEASNTFEVLAGSPALEFEAAEAKIRDIISADARRSLNSVIASNTRLNRDARGRFITSRKQMQSDGAGIASRNNVAFDVDGIAEASGLTLSTKGTFFGQIGSYDGTQRRLLLGDFDIQRNSETGSTTATISGKIAWEQMLSEQTMQGYYVGGELGRSALEGDFVGDQDHYGVSAGGYIVHALQDNLFVDAFASVGIGHNDLEMSNGTLQLESDYRTKTATLGAALTGVIVQDGFEILPELSFAYGKTFIGDIGFTGAAYGLVDKTLSLDAGDISIATVMFRPDFRIPLDDLPMADSLAILSFAPRLICEQVKVGGVSEDNCGGGAELGVKSNTSDGLSSATMKILVDRVGNSTRSGFQFQLEHRF